MYYDINELIKFIYKDELYSKILEMSKKENSVIGPYNYGYKHAVENLIERLKKVKEN